MFAISKTSMGQIFKAVLGFTIRGGTTRRRRDRPTNNTLRRGPAMFRPNTTAVAASAISALFLAAAAGACPTGVEGYACPSKIVCAEQNGQKWCTVADFTGYFYLFATQCAPSNAQQQCLPTTGSMHLSVVGFPNEGMTINRSILAERLGGTWLQLGCSGIVHTPVVGFANLHLPISDAAVTAGPDGAIIANNIGSTGQDGVQVSIRHSREVSIDWDVIPPPPAGAESQSLTAHALGEIDAQNQVVASVGYRFRPAFFDVFVDFSAQTDGPVLVEVIRDGAVLASFVAPQGDVAEAALAASRVSFESTNGARRPRCAIGWHIASNILTPIGAFEADEIRISPDPGAPSIPVAAITGAAILAADTGPIRITGETSVPLCAADLNADGQVTAADLALLLGAWGTGAADLNGDGVTNASDLAALLGSWGACA